MFSNFLKKSLEIIVPKTNDPFGDLKKACLHIIAILKKEENENISSLNDSLNLVQETLLEELETKDMVYFDYISKSSFLKNLVDSISKENLRKVHVEPILNFFMAFLNTKLNHYFAQISVHHSFGLLLSKLELLYEKSPEITYKFVMNVWNLSKKSPLILDLTMIHDENDSTKVYYPLFDFFCESIFEQAPLGTSARDVVLSLFSLTEEGMVQIDSQFKKYVSAKVFPIIIEQLSMIMDISNTIQFNGTLSIFIIWIDQLLNRCGGYDMNELFIKLDNLSEEKQISSLAFFLAYFNNPSIKDKALNLARSQKIKDIILKMMNDFENMNNVRLSFVILNIILRRDELVEEFMPSKCSSKTDVLSILPPQWLSHLDGEYSIDSYQKDALSRIFSFKQCHNGKNDIFYKTCLKLLREFNKLNINTALGLTGLLTTFLSINPSLVDDVFAESYEIAVKQYIHIQILPTFQEMKEDAPNVRAAILSEFGKEIHATYLVSEKIAANENLFVDDLI